ncbi:MAG: YraN family protein [Motiliproteus sp.]|nr:YraN family protein [Motiliproteus sp.]
MSRAQGSEIEEQAQKYLQQQGLKPVTQNFSCRQGEIDLVMQQGQQLVFVEVRYRKNSHYGSSSESVDWRKQQKLAATAQQFLQKNRRWQNHPCRFDVIACSPDKDGIEFQWIINAFDC